MNSENTNVLIHELAQVYTDTIGSGTRIWQYAVILEGACIGSNCNINCHTLVEGKAILGDRVTLKPGVYIWDGVELENDVMVGPNATFTNDKWPKSGNKFFILERTLVKQGSSIGANATILCGLTIGEFSLIAAGSVVTKSVPDRALMMGNPARRVGWMNQNGTKMKSLDGHYIDENNQIWHEKNGLLVRL